jgi:superfamily II DNA or RNA helicase
MYEDIIKVEKFDEVYMKITSDSGIKQELSDYFSFYAEGYQFNPKFKNKIWDGKIRLYSPFKPLLYIGLLSELKKFAEVREYKLDIDKDLIVDNKITEKDILDLCEEIKTTLKPRDYQIKYILNALNKNRSISLSPTSSGKSFIQYLIQQFYYRNFSHKTLLVVPTVSLVLQMQSDFIDYGCDPNDIHTIKSGSEKNSNKPIIISTWQSLQKMNKEWFAQFKVICGDEAHLFAAKSLVTIMENLKYASYRHGFSGTIPKNSKVNQLLLQGLFGEIKSYITTSDLIDNGTVADFNIKILVLNYSPETKKQFIKAIKELPKEKRYFAEKEFISNNRKRNNFLKNLVLSMDNKNNLILFDMVEKHGKILEPLLQHEDKKLHFIYGAVSGEDREKVRKEVEADSIKRHNILASYQTLSTGVSIKRLDTVIFASGSKSEVRVLQSIGRVLRKGNGSDKAILYDIVDDLSKGSFINYTLDHFKKRLEFYNEQNLNYKIYNIDLF